jgi:hypothetical protein
MKNIKVWPHLIVVLGLAVLGLAVVAGVGLALFSKHEQTVEAAALPNAARIQRVDGNVSLSNSPDNSTDKQGNDGTKQWVAASPNEPFSVGDRIYTRDKAHCTLAFSGRNFAKLDPNTSLDAVTLADDRTQLALRDGAALFDIGDLPSGETFEVGTPYGAVDFNQPGLYNVSIDKDGAIVSAFSGQAQIVGMGGKGEISKGETITLPAQTGGEATLSHLDRRNAGYLVDDYYHYRYPKTYDGRYRDYDAYQNDPFYYDPYRRDASYKYVTSAMPGVDDLDDYGDWQNVSSYGNCWRPRVDVGWTPYQQGSWTNDYPYGPTWVSSESWGYAPYHYGRWTNQGDQWFWIPDAINTTPRYSPALVAFVSFGQDDIGWVPLGPGDPYVGRYYDETWQPHYLTRGNVVAANLVNFRVQGAVTVVPIGSFGRTIDARVITRVDPQMLARGRPTFDPLTLTPLRTAVLNPAWGRGRTDLPPGVAQRLHDTPVVVSAAPVAPPFRKDLAKTLRVEPVPNTARNQKLKLNDERNVSQPGDTARQSRQPAQQQGKDQLNQQSAQQRAVPRAQGERIGNPAKVAAAPRPLDPGRVQRKAAPQAQGVKVGNPAKSGAAPRPLDPGRAQRKAAPQAQGVKVGNPARSGPGPQPRAPRTQPQPPRRAAAPQQLKQSPKPQPQGAPKQGGKPPAPASSEAKGKDKHP